jgi:hypothetical protein
MIHTKRLSLATEVRDKLAGISSRASSVGQSEVGIAILRSGDLEYTRGITYGFKTRLQQEQEKLDTKFEYYELTGPEEPPTRAVIKKKWKHLVELLLKRGEQSPYDYYVAIGTQASLALEQGLADNFEKTPFVFLGVTDPIRCELVTSLQDRRDERNIAGVTYGGDADRKASLLSYLFPGRKLIYIYQRGIPQDETIAWALKRNKLFREGVLSIKATRGKPTLADMPDMKAVYFSWYTFETMFEDNSGLDLLRERLMVTTADRANVVPRGLAIADVSAEDEEIGRLGAEIIIEHQSKGIDLGHRDISNYACFISRHFHVRQTTPSFLT